MSLLDSAAVVEGITACSSLSPFCWRLSSQQQQQANTGSSAPTAWSWLAQSSILVLWPWGSWRNIAQLLLLPLLLLVLISSKTEELEVIDVAPLPEPMWQPWAAGLVLGWDLGCIESLRNLPHQFSGVSVFRLFPVSDGWALPGSWTGATFHFRPQK